MKPIHIMLLLLFAGMVLLVVGVYIVAGLGPALLVSSIPFLLAAAVLIRGLSSV